MAGLPSVYQDGTTSITTGTKAVVGQSTMFTKSLLPGDFYGAHRGFAIMIASIEDDTHLTLADNYPGPTQAAAAYKIMLQSDIGRHSEAIRQLLLKLSSGNIEALAGLDGATDKFPFFTGAGTMDVGDVSPYARSHVLNKADRAGLLAGIGVSDTVSAIPSTVSDLNNVTSTGWVWAISPGTLNCPGAGGFIVNTMQWNNPSIILQTAYDATSGASVRRQWSRLFYVTGWQSWIEQVSNPLLGTVSQSSGIPTGAIIEPGSNAGGDYRRFADGTQICTRSFTSVFNVNSLFGTWYYGSTSWIFPVPFSSSAFGISSSCRANGQIITTAGGDHTVSGAETFFVSSVPLSSVTITTKQTAIGRWY